MTSETDNSSLIQQNPDSLDKADRLYKVIRTTADFFGNDRHQKTIISVICVIMPMIIFFGWLHFTGVKLTNLCPYESDSHGWFSQTHNVIKYGRSLGYEGYNETHAPVGHSGPWGTAIVWFMSFGGRLLGWYSWSPYFLNAIKWLLANLCFLLFVRPNKQQLIRLTVIQLLLFINAAYFFTAMSELTRFSMAIFLAGLMYYLLYNPDKNSAIYRVILYALTPAVFVTFIPAYMMFAFALPIYGYVIYRRYSIQRIRPIWVNVIISIAVFVIIPLICLVILYKLNAMTAAPYPGNDNSPLARLDRDHNIGAFIAAVWNIGWKNLMTLKLGNIIRTDIASPFGSYKFMYSILCILAAVNLISAIVQKGSRKRIELAAIMAGTLLVFMIGFCCLYTVAPSNYGRGVNVGLNFVLYLFCMYSADDISVHNSRQNNRSFLYVAAVMLICLAPWLGEINAWSSKYKDGKLKEVFLKRQRTYAEYLKLDPKADPWRNTIALAWRRGIGIDQLCTSTMLCSAPAGFGQQLIFSYHCNRITKCGYVVTHARFKQEIGINTVFHDLIYSDEDIIIYKHK